MELLLLLLLLLGSFMVLQLYLNYFWYWHNVCLTITKLNKYRLRIILKVSLRKVYIHNIHLHFKTKWDFSLICFFKQGIHFCLVLLCGW